MKLFEYLDGSMASFILTAMGVGFAIALLGGLLSPLVVLKRMSFVGQGISHSAFGGVGVAAILGLTAAGGWEPYAFHGVITIFCLLAATGIAVVSERRRESEDTVIGIFLVGAMAFGALLLHVRHRLTGATAGIGWESVLFGSITEVGEVHLALSWGVLVLVALILFTIRHQVIFWAFDEPAAAAFGIRTSRMRLITMLLLGVAVLASMRLAGVVLTTALLVLPGAAALQLSRRIHTVWFLSLLLSVVGVLGGFVLAVETGLPPGPSMVSAMILLYVLSWPASLWRR